MPKEKKQKSDQKENEAVMAKLAQQGAVGADQDMVEAAEANVSSLSTIEISPDGKRAEGRNGLTIEYRGIDTCPYGRSATARKKRFEAVVIHHTSPRHTLDWYVQYQIDGDRVRGGHFGYHFYIGVDGRIVQGAPLNKRTNHIKPSGAPQRRPFGKIADNTNAIGITCSGAGRPSFQPTAAQKLSLHKLSRAICIAYNIDFANAFGHGEIQTDRHETEGRSAAEEMRSWSSARGIEILRQWKTDEAVLDDDDMDDSPIEALSFARGEWDPEIEGFESEFDIDIDLLELYEDDDDQSPDAILSFSERFEYRGVSAAESKFIYVNQNAIRNKKCTNNIEEKLLLATEGAYGPGCTIKIYSGGQDRRGHGSRRTGSVRHDDYGQGGRAADIYVFDRSGRQIQGLELAILGQYWLASRFGGVGHEMRGGGIHLDEWTTPPRGGGMFWTYAYSQSKPWGARARQMLELGARGIFP